MSFKSGFVAVIGRPNVGKSTLLNSLVNEDIAIVSKKPQTTRSNIMGILTGTDFQIIFSDTPGVHKAKNLLGEHMQKSYKNALTDVDLALFLADATRNPGEIEEAIISDLKKRDVPTILLLNKIDLVMKDKLLPLISAFSGMYDFKEIIPISALKNDGVPALVDIILGYLPEGPAYYDADMITEQPERQIAAEKVREKMLQNLNQEVPHGIFVAIDKMNDQPSLMSVACTVFCERDNHKGIIIGKNGETLKRIAKAARDDMERFWGKKVFLEIFVKVADDWRDNKRFIQEYF